MTIKKYYNQAKHQLFPICRSITGNGVRKTLKIIKKNFSNLKIKEVPSGKKVFDWIIPPEWNINNAYVVDKYNNKIIDFKNNNLHVVNYSFPVNKKLTKKELFEHIYSLPNKKNAIPYVTSYYKKNWGFCITHSQKTDIDKNYKNQDKFKVKIDSSFKKKGHLTYGELLLKGKSTQEILVSTYICHPSMANNELSGSIVSMGLIDNFKNFKNLKKSIRFIFIPETIGSITYINKNWHSLKKNLIGGYNLSCIGDDREYSCMYSKYGNTQADKALKKAFNVLKINFKTYSFLKRGSDERQYNSPGVDLPIASVFRTKYGEYPEYHTSLDDFNVVTQKGVNGGYQVVKKAINILLNKIIPISTILCEPQMNKKGLYSVLGKKDKLNYIDLKNFIQYADGKNDLEAISKYIKLNIKMTKTICKILVKHKLIRI